MNDSSFIERQRRENAQIAQTIFEHLGGSRFLTLTGATTSVMERGLRVLFHSSIRRRNSPNCAEIHLKGKNLYDCKFYRLRGLESTVINEIEDVFADSLRTCFTVITGLEV